MPKIFISYRREDSGVITARIFDGLAAHYGRDAVFRDIDVIPLGVNFQEHIQREIHKSDIVLVVIGPRWLGRKGDRITNAIDPVRLEVEAALRNGKVVIPILVLRSPMPRQEDLPRSLRELALRHAIQLDIGRDFDVHMQRLIRAMDRILESSEEALLVAPPSDTIVPDAPRVFRAGDPIRRDREAFVPRFAVLTKLESFLELDTGCPALLLYGRRRTGKSTILSNLLGFLPANVRLAEFSMLSPRAFTSTELFCALVADQISSAMEWDMDLHIGELRHSNLVNLADLLAHADGELATQNERLLISVDEYENLDRKIGDRSISVDVLSLIRDSIQRHRNIVWMFAGSHHVSELRNAPWSSFFVSAQTVEVPLFSYTETERLLTEPLLYSRIWDSDDPMRPRFDSKVWGNGGIAQIHEEAGGWPHLVQLIADTVVDLLNQTSLPSADPELVGVACDQAIIRGDTALRELVQMECTSPAEWEYICGFRRTDAQRPPDNHDAYSSLRRRLLVTEEHGYWRMRVPLMQRWLRERG